MNGSNAWKSMLAVMATSIVVIAQVPDETRTDPIWGFARDSSAWQQEYEKKLRDLMSTERVEEHLRWLSREPHLAGSPRTREIVEYLDQRLREYGFESEIVRYDAYLPDVRSVLIELVEPVHESIPTTEDRVEGDPFTDEVEKHPGWMGYSPSGEATAEVVYGHFGSEHDLQTLVDMGIDLRGKILLLRFFGIGEGRMVRNAERFGAAGVVLYVDPEEDGHRHGYVYPKGNWRPPGSIMRRSIISLPYEGDPLSPGWASVAGAKRLPVEDVEMPRIPVLPVSYRSAERIMELMAGPVAPRPWRGAMGLTYRVGPGPARVHIRTDMDNRDRPMWNVIGRMEGSVYPDQWVLIGNHHDAWIFGAGDPSSGTASLLELAKGIGELTGAGFRPKRTLIVAFWDAEEMLLGGSTEWVEDHAEDLLDKAVAYINMDSSVFNVDRPLSVSAHTNLHRLFRTVAQDIRDPRSQLSLFETWLNLQNEFRKVPSVDGWDEFFDADKKLLEPHIRCYPFDDATPFYNLLALPASDMYYGADYGMYHSIYENFHWMKTVADPTFEYHVLMAELQGRVALRLANADLLPLDYTEEARYWGRAYRQLNDVAQEREQHVPRLTETMQLIDEWEEQAEALAKDIETLLGDASRWAQAKAHWADWNRMMYRVARDFYRPEGRVDSPWERNLFFGSSYDFEGVSGSTVPGIRFALDEGDMELANEESAMYLDALRRRLKSLSDLRRQIRGEH